MEFVVIVDMIFDNFTNLPHLFSFNSVIKAISSVQMLLD